MDKVNPTGSKVKVYQAVVNDDNVYDISNLRRLGRSEVDLVQDMYDGVKAMI
jgi:hypothetical protein